MMSRGTAMKLWRRSVSGALILLFGVQAAVPASAVPWQQSQPTQTVSIGSSRAPSFLRTTRPHPEVLRGVLPPPGILVQGPAMRRTPLQPQPVGTARLNNGQSLPKTLSNDRAIFERFLTNAGDPLTIGPSTANRHANARAHGLSARINQRFHRNQSVVVLRRR
jgi:hypothetical protein